MTELWALTYDCGDYYCEGEHLSGVYSSQEQAVQAVKFLKLKRASLAEHRTYSVHALNLDETDFDS